MHPCGSMQATFCAPTFAPPYGAQLLVLGDASDAINISVHVLVCNNLVFWFFNLQVIAISIDVGTWNHNMMT